MKYKLKLDYTVDELKELKELSYYNSPMDAIIRVARADAVSEPFRKLMLKLPSIAVDEEFDFMADINNVVMGDAKFPEKTQVSTQCGLNVDHVEVDGKRFKLTNGYIVEVKNV